MPSCILCDNYKCSHGCCCYCLIRENCHECKNGLCSDIYIHKENKFIEYYTNKLFICFPCKSYQKKKEYDEVERLRYEDYYYYDKIDRSLCNKCHNKMIQVDSRIRVPKKKDKKEWIKLEKLVNEIDCKYIPYFFCSQPYKSF